MASPTQWTWLCVDSRSWWWTGRPGVLHFMGSQRVVRNWATELNSEINQFRPQQLALQESAVAKCFCHSCSLRRPSQPRVVAQDSDTSHHFLQSLPETLSWIGLPWLYLPPLPSTFFCCNLYKPHFIIYQFPTSEVCVQVSFASDLTWNLAFLWGYGFTWSHFERKFHIFYEPQSWEMECTSLSLTIITLEQKLLCLQASSPNLLSSTSPLLPSPASGHSPQSQQSLYLSLSPPSFPSNSAVYVDGVCPTSSAARLV